MSVGGFLSAVGIGVIEVCVVGQTCGVWERPPAVTSTTLRAVERASIAIIGEEHAGVKTTFAVGVRGEGDAVWHPAV